MYSVVRGYGVLVLALLLFAGAITTRVEAQDSNYWTYTYGTRASLLNGIVIGSVVDISATYYNPGALPLIEDIEVVMAARVFHYPNVWLRRVGGSDADLTSSNFGQAPGLVAGMFKINWAGGNRIGYSILTRQRASLDIAGGWVGTRDSIPGFPDAVSASADLRLDEDLSETWVGISWGYGFNDHLAIGVTQYATFRYHKAAYQSRIQNLKEDGSLALATYFKHYDYTNWRLLWKFGTTFEHSNLSLGITFTTPGIKLYDDGASGINITSTGIDLDGIGPDDTFMAVDYASGLESDYRTPASAGLGATYLFGATRVHFSTEWFASIDEYAVIDAGDFPAQSGGDTLSNMVTNENDPVINYGIGLEHSFRENFQAYCGFATDFSAQNENRNTNLCITDWDIYGVTGGVAFSHKRFQVTFGLGYSWGSKKSKRQTVVLTQADGDPGFVNNGVFDYKNIKGVIGFAF